MRSLLMLLAIVGIAAGVGFMAAPPKPGDPLLQTPDLGGPKVGKPAPAFSYTTLDGKRVTNQSYAGKVLLVDVFSVT